MSCRSCSPVLDCDPLGDFQLYALNGELFPFVLNCPPGFSCSNPQEFRITCCGQVLAASVQPGASSADAAIILSNLLQQCALKTAACQDPNNPQFDSVPPDHLPDPTTPITLYWNESQSCVSRCPDGTPFTYTVGPVSLGSTQAEANLAAHNYACTLARAHSLCLTPLPANCCVGVPFSNNISVIGGFGGSAIWELLSGTPPTGLTLATGLMPTGTTSLTGTPTTPGSFTFTVKVTAANGDVFQKTYIMCAVKLTASPPGSDDSHLPDATSQIAYTDTILATNCASTPIVWTITAGTLAPGLALNPSTGVISGIPTTPGDYTFTVTATMP